MSFFILLSPAKLNLYLKIISKRKDGYHNLNSLIQKVSIFDIIKISFNTKKKLINFSNSAIDKDNNTIKKVIELFVKKTGINFNYEISVKKNIPIEAGLGGGSSNAATILNFLNNYFYAKLSLDDLINIGKSIGADVPLFLYPSSLLLMYGIGDKIKSIESLKSNYNWFVLIKPDKSLSTKKVYTNLNFVLTNFNKNIMEDSLFEIGVNDLEKSAFEILPILKDIKRFLKRYTKFSLMTGSGSVIFGGFSNKKDALNCYIKAKEKFINYQIIICRTL